jgi:hypothetical protein
MKERSPFDPSPDAELGALLREHYSGPDPERFLDELRDGLKELPSRDTEWDVLGRWARPGVIAAAVIAGFALGFALWRRLDQPVLIAAPSVASVAMLEPRGAEVTPMLAAVLEVR